MIFAQIPQAAYSQITNDKMFRIYAIVQIEMFESGAGVCGLPVGALAKKHNQNPDSFSRYFKQMIKLGFLIKVVGGIITNSFNNTDEKSVEAEDELTKNQFTDEKSVNPLTRNQLITDEKSGTEIANKDLEFKSLNIISLSTRARIGLTVDEAADYLDNPPEIPEENLSPTKAIEIWREVYPRGELVGERLHDFAAMLPDSELDTPEKQEAWRTNLKEWKISNWNADNISGQIKRFREIEAKKNGVNTNGNGKHSAPRHNGDVRNGHAADSGQNSGNYNPFAGKRVI